MQTYKLIRRDIMILILLSVILTAMTNKFDVGLDDTDKDGRNRSGVELVTDYGTGKQYLYKNGALIPRSN